MKAQAVAARTYALKNMRRFAMITYPNLPETVVVYDTYTNTPSEGAATEGASEGAEETVQIPAVVYSRSTLFILPIIGALAWLINGIWGITLAMRRQSLGAYILWSGTIIVQICSFFAQFPA